VNKKMNPENKNFGNGSCQEREVAHEVVEEIENSTFDFIDKVPILLVGAGLKPAALIYPTTREGADGSWIKFTDEEIEEQRNLLRKIGFLKEGRRINSKAEWTDGRATHFEQTEFMFANSPENLERLAAAIREHDEREIGLALGYAETAVDAYSSGELLSPADEAKLPEEVATSEAYVFNPGRLSAEHWRDELAQYQKWAEYIKKTSPIIYNKMMGIAQK
jgi:hypothetical protein